MVDKPSVIRETDDEARQLARTLLRSARFVALAVMDPQTGFPSVSRVLLGTDSDGAAVILVSALSAHTRALSADPRVSLLAGEPGKGDPLAYPRLTLQCLAETVDRETPQHDRLRQRFIARHPKSKLYIDFPDFRFFRLLPQSASLNGGFGRAYILPGQDFLIHSDQPPDFADSEFQTLQDLGVRYPDSARRIAVAAGGSKDQNWQFCGLDMAGIDLISGDSLLRFEFGRAMTKNEDIISVISKTASSIP